MAGDPIIDTRTGKQVGVVLYSKECKLGCGKDALDFAGLPRELRSPSGSVFCDTCSGCPDCCKGHLTTEVGDEARRT
jgi:hypothetical protein